MILVITGGSGSLGRAILAQQDLLASHGITKIRIISRDEQKQISISRSYSGEIPLDCYLGDVCDKDRMSFALKDANFVVHAAAQKHIEKFELDIPTGYKTNIRGTQNVADAFMAARHPISGLFVSTDKACEPITPYGVSKLAAEHLWLWYNTYQKNVRFGVSRYGNVFGSKGSVIETWTRAAKNKESLKITDPECTRFFIQLPEAARYVIKCLFRNSKELHIPEMKSAKMMDVARIIHEHWNSKSKFVPIFLGMRSIEKTHEILEKSGKTSFDSPRFKPEELREMYKAWLFESSQN